MSLAGASVIKMAHAYLGAEAFRRWDQWDGWIGVAGAPKYLVSYGKIIILIYIYSSPQLDRKLIIDDYV